MVTEVGENKCLWGRLALMLTMVSFMLLQKCGMIHAKLGWESHGNLEQITEFLVTLRGSLRLAVQLATWVNKSVSTSHDQ
jgi:hypothetical protein